MDIAQLKNLLMTSDYTLLNPFEAFDLVSPLKLSSPFYDMYET
jgi:hypothetical protein